MEIEIILENTAELPEYKTEGSAGVDLCSNEENTLKPGEIKAIGTGIKVAIPEGCEAQIRTRSGMAVKGIVVLNSPGTIDSDYRGEIMVILYNVGKEEFKINKGMRIAQMVFAKFEKIEFVLVKELDKTIRNTGGLGSTGL